ncbi:MAG: hypothetical protein ACXVB0_10275 [Mucilaginibacter sp.]
MNKAESAVIMVTAYLMTYVILSQTSVGIYVVPYLFLTSPFLLIWMVYSVLKDDLLEYPELGKKDEWGYHDKAKDELGMF